MHAVDHPLPHGSVKWLALWDTLSALSRKLCLHINSLTCLRDEVWRAGPERTEAAIQTRVTGNQSAVGRGRSGESRAEMMAGRSRSGLEGLMKVGMREHSRASLTTHVFHVSHACSMFRCLLLMCMSYCLLQGVKGLTCPQSLCWVDLGKARERTRFCFWADVW